MGWKSVDIVRHTKRKYLSVLLFRLFKIPAN